MTLTELKEKQWEKEFEYYNELKNDLKNVLEHLKDCRDQETIDMCIRNLEGIIDDLGDTQQY